MKVEYRKRFLRELAKIPSAQRKEIEIFVFERLTHIQSVAESGKIERMKSSADFFRIRFGDYRIGLRSDGDTIILERALHRKDIYRYFP